MSVHIMEEPMGPRRVALFGCAALVFFAGSVSCRQSARTDKDKALVATVQAEVETFRQGGKGHGFICWGYPDGGIGCACNDDAPSGDIWSCSGMEKICNLMGTGQICNPSTNWCFCAAYPKKAIA
jgi:L-aminopeptidase/D-esterase-like protein